MAERNVGPAGEGQDTVHRGRHLDGDPLAGKRPARYGARLASGGRHGGHACHGTQQVDKLRHVVGTHIVDWTAAAVIVESGVRMPILHTMRQQGRRTGNRNPDNTFIDRIATRLVRCAQKRIGCTADPLAL